MQIYELLRLVDWFDENIIAKQIPSKYQQLHQVLTQNANVRNNQPKQPFEAQKESLILDLSSIKFDSLSLEQIDLLEKLKIKKLFGTEGVDKVEDVLYKNALDIATAVSKIQENITQLNNAVARFDQFKKSFSGIYSNEGSDEIEENDILMRIYFQGESGINNVADLKKLSSLWYDIGRGVTLANDCSPQDFHIIGAQKGSVILELAAAAAIVTTLSSILLAGLKVTEKVLDILKKVEELKAMKLQNKSIVGDLEKEAESEKQKGIETIIKETVKQLNIDSKKEGDKITALEKSIKNLINFTENGGKVDFIQPNEPEADAPNKKEIIQFRDNCFEIRELEQKIKYLEHK